MPQPFWLHSASRLFGFIRLLGFSAFRLFGFSASFGFVRLRSASSNPQPRFPLQWNLSPLSQGCYGLLVIVIIKIIVVSIVIKIIIIIVIIVVVIVINGSNDSSNNNYYNNSYNNHYYYITINNSSNNDNSHGLLDVPLLGGAGREPPHGHGGLIAIKFTVTIMICIYCHIT